MLIDLLKIYLELSDFIRFAMCRKKFGQKQQFSSNNLTPTSLQTLNLYKIKTKIFIVKIIFLNNDYYHNMVMFLNNELIYFLNSLKDELNFNDLKDFYFKIKNDFSFRMKVQKFVYIAKFYGWNHYYPYSMYIRGPYSSLLSDDYYNPDIVNWNSFKIIGFNLEEFRKFIKDKSIEYLEAVSTLLFLKNSNSNFSNEALINKVSSIKPYIGKNIINNALIDISTININKDILTNTHLHYNINLKNEVSNELIEFISLFEKLDINRNNIIILGSLDYLRIVLREEKLDKNMEFDLIQLIKKYILSVKEIYDKIINNLIIIESSDISDIESEFDRLQDYISEELNIFPRLDSDDLDESLLY